MGNTRQCEVCGLVKPLLTHFVFHKSGKTAGVPCYGCRLCRSKAASAWQKKNRAEKRSYSTEYRSKDPEKWRRINNSHSKRYRDARRVRVLAAYGGACACCGEKEPQFLSIDHIFGGGRKHLKTLGGLHLYEWLERNEYPNGFRVLCHNCNQARGHYGSCPHERAAYDVPYAVKMEA